MGADSKIEWTTHTFNPWVGCTKVSPGCDHCYAEGWAKRSGHVQWGPGAERRRTSAANWRQPVKWNAEAATTGTRPRVFCASLADVFDNEVPIEWRADLFALIQQTPHLDWLLLTKRIGNVAGMVSIIPGWMPDNVWLGASIVNQQEADRDIPKLLQVPAAKRFLSMEPLLGPVDLTPFLWGKHDAIDKVCQNCPRDADCECGYWTRGPLGLPSLNWVIVGGESGPHARPMHPQWARSLRDQCTAAGVAFHFKQWGEWLPSLQDGARDRRLIQINASDVPMRVGKKAAGRLLDGRTWDEVPG